MNEKDIVDSDENAGSNRRRFLRLLNTASIAALAGCADSVGDGGEEANTTPSDWCVSEYDVEVPELFRTAESIDGIQRTPEDLSSREEAAYQCHPQGYQLCANCRFFIPARPGETEVPIGACAIVEGRMRSQDWCALYQETERIGELPHSEPLEEPGIQEPPDT